MKYNNTDFEETILLLNQLGLITDKTSEYIQTITDFSNWCATSIEKEQHHNTELKACYYIFEDFVKSNEHIIQKINHYNDHQK